MKTIIITGVAGYIGSQLAYYFLKKNYKIIGIDDFSNSTKRDISRLFSFKNFKFYKENINSLDITIFKKEKIDFFIHLAAVSSVEKANDNKIKTYESNVLGLRSAINLADKLKCKSFLFASSAAVYGNTKKFPILENHQLKSESLYGFSKIINENQISNYKNKIKMNFKILRLFNVYGGNKFLEKNKGVISNWINSILKNKPLILDNKGRCVRDFIYIDDIIQIIERLLFIKKKKIEIYNIGSGNKTSLTSLFKTLKKVIQKKEKKYKFKIINRNLSPSQIEYSYSSNKKIKQLLNFKFTNLENGINNLINDIL